MAFLGSFIFFTKSFLYNPSQFLPKASFLQENQYEKIRVLFFKLIEETKELSDNEFENIVNQVFKENESFTPEMKERLVIDIAKMRSKILN